MLVLSDKPLPQLATAPLHLPNVGKLRLTQSCHSSDAGKANSEGPSTLTPAAGGAEARTTGAKISDGGTTNATTFDAGVTIARTSDGGTTAATTSDGGTTSARISDGGATAANTGSCNPKCWFELELSVEKSEKLVKSTW